MSNSTPTLTKFSRLDKGLLAVLLLTCFATIPLLSNVGLPNGSDVLYHTYRVGEMQRSWEHGVFFPSWAEGLYFGYGSPLFHFYASLTYYLTSIITIVFGASALDALRIVLMLSFFGCGCGMWGDVPQMCPPSTVPAINCPSRVSDCYLS